MNKIEEGKTYTAKSCKHGVSKKGAWTLLKVQPEKNDNIDVWATNELDLAQLEDGVRFKVNAIHSISLGKREYNGKWYPIVSCEATVAIVSKKQEEYTDLPGVFNAPVEDFGDLPF